MKKIIFIWVLLIVLISTVIFLYRFYINKKSMMTYRRMNGDIVVIKFNREGIENVKINEKKLDNIELSLYKARFIGDFTWIQINEKEYNELELIQEYIKKVSNYEENNEEYNLLCVYK